MMDAVVQRLDADAVTNEPELAFLRVPEADREHTAKAVNAIDPPLLKCVQDHFGVGVVRSPDVPSTLLQFRSYLCMVVYLPVEHHPEAAIFVRHRLSGTLRQVDD